MEGVLLDLPAEQRASLHPEEPPTLPEPMLAVLARASFSDPDWIFERKLSGERVLAVADDEGVRLVSRNGVDLSSSYPEVIDALREDRAGGALAVKEGKSGVQRSFVVDGEIVAFSDSVTSFPRLQERIGIAAEEKARNSPVKVYYYVFDLLHLGGFGLRQVPLRARKKILRNSVTFRDPIRFTEHRRGEGEALFRKARHKGWEGVVAKRGDSLYRGGRSRDWRKLKCVNRQGLVIGGFTDPGGSRVGFGALLVGYFEEGVHGLRYAGKVGTGFDREALKRVTGLLRARVRKTPPFAKEDRGELPGDGVHWVTPNLVGHFGFAEWTPSGKLRHPRFLGLRRDKNPEEVVREIPV